MKELALLKRAISSQHAILTSIVTGSVLLAGAIPVAQAAPGALSLHPSRSGVALVEQSEFLPLTQASELMTQKDYKTALPLLEKAIERNPANILSLFHQGTTYLELAKASNDKLEQGALLKRSREAFERVLDISDNFILPYFKLGKVALMMDDIEGAKKVYTKGLELDPMNATLVFNLARVYDQNNEKAEAIRLYHQVLTIDPNFTYAYNNLALMYEEMNQPHEAEKAYHKALSKDKNYNLARMNLANLYANQGRYGDAHKLLDVVIAQEGENAWPYYYLGNLYMRTGQYAQASTAYKKSLSLNTGNPTAWYLLAVSYTQLHQMDEALQAGLHYLHMEPEGRYAREMQQLVLTAKLSHSGTTGSSMVNPTGIQLETK